MIEPSIHVTTLVKNLEFKLKIYEDFIKSLTHVSVQNSNENQLDVAVRAKQILDENS